jgi:hypothetical protein
MVNVSERITSCAVWIAKAGSTTGPGTRRDRKRHRGEQRAQTLNHDAGGLEGYFPERDYESAARSLRAGIAAMFTLHRLKLLPSLYIMHGRDQGMVERWAASAWPLATILRRKTATEISQEK